MFWYPSTGAAPLDLTWSAGFITHGLVIATLIGLARVAVLVLRRSSWETPSMSLDSAVMHDEPEVRAHAA